MDFPLDPHVHVDYRLQPEDQVRAAFEKGLSINLLNYYEPASFEALRSDLCGRLPEFDVKSFDTVLRVSKGNRTIHVFRG